MQKDLWLQTEFNTIMLLQIFDGTSGTHLATFCGNNEIVVEGHSHSVTLNFNTDGSVTGTGWVVEWYSKY